MCDLVEERRLMRLDDGLREDWFLSDEVSYGFDGLPSGMTGTATTTGGEECNNNNDYSSPSTTSSTTSSTSSSSSSSPSSSLNGIRFRPIQPQDRDTIQLLHEEWFPVRYQSEFYDDLIRHGQNYWGHASKSNNNNNSVGTSPVAHQPHPHSYHPRVMHHHQQCQHQQYHQHRVRTRPTGYATTTTTTTGCSSTSNSNSNAHHGCGGKRATPSRSLYTCLAVRGGGGGRIGIEGDKDVPQPYCYNVADEEDPYGSCSTSHFQKDEQICACVVGCFLQASQLSPVLRDVLFPASSPFLSHHDHYVEEERGFYIMTLGVVPSYRKEGLGSLLVQKCQSLVEQQQDAYHCNVLYLHVITFNKAAIRLYEKLGFIRVQEIENYYSIHGKNHNCYLYAKYLNNGGKSNRGHYYFFPDIFHFAKGAATVLWKQFLTSVFPALMQYLPLSSSSSSTSSSPPLRSSSSSSSTCSDASSQRQRQQQQQQII